MWLHKHVPKTNCICEDLQANYENFISSWLGEDPTLGRYAAVSIECCTTCQRKWLRYMVEFESFSCSGRFYRGIIDEKDLESITPENAIAYIESLDWYIYGGSYFSTRGQYGRGKAMVDR